MGRRRARALFPEAKLRLNNGRPARAQDEDDIYDVTPPPQKRARLVSNPSNEAELGSEIGNTDNWIRRSTRQREPVTTAADMIKWDDIDAEEYDVAFDDAISE